VPLDRQPVFEQIETSNLEMSAEAAEEVISLPMHPYLEAADAGRVVAAVHTAVSGITA
jgi:UDP-2-acetamido-2-deoxy-ribo-hexuluronate aminotransferase